MSFRKPTMRKVSRKVTKPKKSLRRLTRKSVKLSRSSKRPPTSKLPPSKKKRAVHLGACYAGLNCTGKILLKRSTKEHCKQDGGKSWRGTQGCVKIKN